VNFATRNFFTVDRCIYRENESSDCPTCKHPLSESELFPDNFANREIQSLTVKCPNTHLGCTVVIELRNVMVSFVTLCPKSIRHVSS